jgi:thiamine kinase-like enzyme
MKQIIDNSVENNHCYRQELCSMIPPLIIQNLIHSNERNISYKAIKNNINYYFKKSVDNKKFLNETLSMKLFSKVNKELILDCYETEDDFVLLTEWLDGYKWIDYDLDSSYNGVYEKIGQFLSLNKEINSYDNLKNQLSFEEISCFLEVKKKMVSMYVTVYNLLKDYESFVHSENIASNYKNLLDIFVKENKILIHGDLNRSNILCNNEFDLKIVDFEFSTFSSLEFELGRFFTSFIMKGLEDYREKQEYNEYQNNILNNMFTILNSIDKNDINLDLMIKFIGFYIINVIFYHKNNFTRIKDKVGYIDYFMPYALLLINIESSNKEKIDNKFVLNFIKKISK